MGFRRAAWALLLLVLVLGAAPGRPEARIQDHEERAAAEAPLRIAVLPFTPRGAPSGAWEDVRDLLYEELEFHGVEVVRNLAIERELKVRRLREMSILSREDLQSLATLVGADRVLLGYIFRMDDLPDPAVSLSGRLVDPATLRIERMSVTLFEGRSFLGPLGVGGPVTLERTLKEVVHRFAVAILAPAGGRSAGETAGKVLRGSVLAPSPFTYVAPDLEEHGIRKIVVLPFRNNTSAFGAGQIAADLMAWSLAVSGHVELLEPGDTAYRMLQQGWRTGIPVGRPAILSLASEPGVDGVLMGSVETWEEGSLIARTPPAVTISARLLETGGGRILWAAEHDRLGDETRVVYEVGNVRLVEALAARSSFEALAPLTKVLAKGSQRRGERN